MINFKTRQDILPSALIIFSILILVLTLAYIVLVPAPADSSGSAGYHASNRRIVDEISDYKERETEAEAAVAPKEWVGSQNDVIANVLALITAKTAAQSVQVTAFRPQRIVDLDGATELPFTVQLAGSFSGIRAVLRDLDAPKSKIVIRSIQVNASEQATDAVTSTIGISVFIPSPAAANSETTQGAANGQTN